MSTVVFVQSYKTAKDRALRHLPTWRTLKYPIVGINTTNGAHWWPSDVDVEEVGDECSVTDGPALIDRFLDMIALFCCEDRYGKYSHLMMIESDCVVLRKPPFSEPDIYSTLAGHCPAKWNTKAKRFWHVPYWMRRDIAEQILEKGDELRGEVKPGQATGQDTFFGFIVESLKIEPKHGKTWTCNSRDMHVRIDEALANAVSGVWLIHGVNTEEQFRQIMANRG